MLLLHTAPTRRACWPIIVRALTHVSPGHPSFIDAPAPPARRLEGMGATLPGIFPLIDEACRLPGAKDKVGW